MRLDESMSPEEPPVSVSQHWDYRLAPPCMAFLHELWGSNWGPHTCTVSTLSSHLSPLAQDSLFFLFLCLFFQETVIRCYSFAKENSFSFALSKTKVKPKGKGCTDAGCLKKKKKVLGRNVILLIPGPSSRILDLIHPFFNQNNRNCLSSSPETAPDFFN